jgi:type IV pilus assembly protein PilY1
MKIIILASSLSTAVAVFASGGTHAANCEQNAAQPKSISLVYDMQAGQREVVVIKPGADGTMRAIDEASGSELWAFVPPGLDTLHRADGLMSDARVLRFDADLDGAIEPADGDRIFLFFGLRRGGRDYYALDISDRSNPRLLWKLGPAELPGVGETWPAPTIARIRIAGATQNGEHLVLILGGGYDEASSSGHRIYFVDAMTGGLLWYAGGNGIGSPDLPLTQMTAPIAARIAAVDTDGDRYVDRLYGADLAGRIWRFDIWNGLGRAQLVTGGVFANLAGPSPEDARRFFHAPDVALIQRRGAEAYYNLAIGSGNRAMPFEAQVHDRFYAIRDRQPFVRLSQSEYQRHVPMTDLDPLDITDTLSTASVPPSAPGWKLDLRLNGGWAGEKVVAEATTANGVILFPTYKPVSEATCTGENRVYALEVDRGRPTLDLNDDRQIDSNDVSVALIQAGIATEIELSLVAPERDDATEAGTTSPDFLPRIECSVGSERLRHCIVRGRPVRTFWQRSSAD